jgi:hypothetical protein
MPQQLVLIDPDGVSPQQRGGERVGADDWHLDAQTREIGLRGIAEARRILSEAGTGVDRRIAAERSAA